MISPFEVIMPLATARYLLDNRASTNAAYNAVAEHHRRAEAARDVTPRSGRVDERG